MKDLVIEFVLLLSLLFGGGDTSSLPSFATSTISYVVDGDTVVLETGEHVRLLGIDTPEKDQCYFAEAKSALEQYVLNKSVYLETDQRNTDKYGRLLRHLFVESGDGRVHVNAKLVDGGFAREYSIPPDTRYIQDLLSAESEAKQTGRGLWGFCVGT